MKELNIDLSEDTIMKMKKSKFKKIIKEKLNEKATEFLFSIKNKENRSKSKKLSSYKFQGYLLTDRLTNRQKKASFFADNTNNRGHL